MPKGKAPETLMGREEAEESARGVADVLENLTTHDALADFVLLLRWLAYGASKTDAENVYIETEKTFAVNFDGVEDTIAAHMRKRAEWFRRQFRKGCE